MSAGPEYSFGPYRFDAKGRMLFRGSRDLGIPPKAAETLSLLLERAGEVVDKSQLLDTVWANVVVGEGSLTRTISILRKALGGEAASRAYIATVSKRGYRFVAPLDRRAEDARLDARVMLLVLPFESSSAARPYDYFNDGLTEEMIWRLAGLNPEQLGVIARTTSMMFKDSKRRVSEIGRELGVQYVLEGTVRRGRDHRQPDQDQAGAGSAARRGDARDAGGWSRSAAERQASPQPAHRACDAFQHLAVRDRAASLP